VESQARQAQWLGAIGIGRPLTFTLVTCAGSAMAAAPVAFACWGEVRRKVTVPLWKSLVDENLKPVIHQCFK
jgi:hypothetical protein